jgi:hypothetical protein
MYPNQYCNPCNEPEPCIEVPAPPDCIGEPCDEIVLDTCVRYTGPAIPCLGITTGANLNQVIQIIAERLCDCCDGTPPVINCEVSEWSAWGPCICVTEGEITTCTQTRTRTVTQAPQNGGTACPPLVETRECCTPVNCVVSEWGPWTTCVGGVRTRNRTVVTPASCGGTPCPVLQETEECSGCNPITNIFGRSLECETMEVTFSDDGNATTLLAELVSTSAPTVVLQSHNFVPTGSASSYLHTFTGVAPGTYIIKVSKNTVSGPCDIVATLSVVVEECPSPIECGTIDPSWVTFGTWDCPSIGYNYTITVPSSATWATGSDLFVNVQKTGTSEVLIQSTYQFSPTIPSSSSFWTFNAPFGGGQMDSLAAPAGTSVTLTLRIECNEEMIQQTYTYVVPACPVEPTDCVVSDWSDWSECVEGVETRTRTIITPAANGGAPCPTLTETRDCELTVDCVVSAWSEWSDCAEGNQTRTRTVITPASGGGVPCPLLEENRPCDLPCPPPTDLTATISE